jgi:predicted Zn-ribbon and HTH transcriptional regulator
MVHCNQCGSDWEPRKSFGEPVQCPRCKRVDWASNKKWSVADMTRAHQAVAQAIRFGRLIRGTCSVCGSGEGVEGHHDDYDKPLSVVWLCKKHHEERHFEIGTPMVDYHKKDSRPEKPMAIYDCKRCGSEWCYRGTGRALRCGRCKSPYWDRVRGKAVGDEVRPDTRGDAIGEEVRDGGRVVAGGKRPQGIYGDHRKAVRGVAAVEPGPDAGAGGDAKTVKRSVIYCPWCGGTVVVPWGPGQVRCEGCGRNFSA